MLRVSVFGQGQAHDLVVTIKWLPRNGRSSPSQCMLCDTFNLSAPTGFRVLSIRPAKHIGESLRFEEKPLIRPGDRNLSNNFLLHPSVRRYPEDKPPVVHQELLKILPYSLVSDACCSSTKPFYNDLVVGAGEA